MKIDGTVTTGLGKAAYFLSQDFYVNNFKKNCGFRPYPGTLNVIVPEEYLPQINKVKNECKNIIKELEKSLEQAQSALIDAHKDNIEAIKAFNKIIFN